MKHTIKRLVAAAALGVTAALPAQAQEVTLDVLYAFPAFARFHEPIAQEFMKKHPSVKIKFRAPAANYDEGHQTMLRSAITNQLPDLYYSGYNLIEELSRKLSERKQIAPLDGFLKAEPTQWIAVNYAPAMLKLGQIEGRQMGLPFNASSPLMYYNADLVKKAGGDPRRMPDTWDGVMALAKKIKDGNSDVAGLAYNIHDWPDKWLWDAMIMQGGHNLLDASRTKVGFGGDVGTRALERLRRFVTEDGMPLINWDQSRQQFIAGKIGIFFDTPARISQVEELVGNRFPLKTALFPIDDKARGTLPTGGNAIVMTTTDAAKQKAAWEFIKFATGPEAQTIVVKMSGYLPTNKVAMEPKHLGAFYDANPNFHTVSGQVDRSAPWSGYPGGNDVQIWRTQRELITAVMRGDMAPKAGIEQMVSKTEALMKPAP